MKRFEKLDETRTPDGTILTLFRHDREYVIHANGAELMSTRRHHSEDLLAEEACAPLRDAAAPRVLIGGLGLGFTLRAALRLLPEHAVVVVAELVGAVIRWNANPEWNLSTEALADPRVRMHEGDVGALIADSAGAFDAIMLDVDNGADALTTAANAALYDDAGLRRTIAALRPGGRAAWWSAVPDPAFARALRRVGLDVREVTAAAYEAPARDAAGGEQGRTRRRGKVPGGTRHVVYLGTVRGG